MRRLGQRVRRAAVRRRHRTVGQYRDRWQGPVVGTRGVCKINDHNSVVSFGVLPGGYTGKMCVQVWIQDRTDRIDSVDVRLNKSDYGWTAKVTGSCRGR